MDPENLDRIADRFREMAPPAVREASKSGMPGIEVVFLPELGAKCQSEKLRREFVRVLSALLANVKISPQDGIGMIAQKIGRQADFQGLDLSCQAVSNQFYFIFQSKASESGFYYVTPDKVRQLQRQALSK